MRVQVQGQVRVQACNSQRDPLNCPVALETDLVQIIVLVFISGMKNGRRTDVCAEAQVWEGRKQRERERSGGRGEATAVISAAISDKAL